MPRWVSVVSLLCRISGQVIYDAPVGVIPAACSRVSPSVCAAEMIAALRLMKTIDLSVLALKDILNLVGIAPHNASSRCPEAGLIPRLFGIYISEESLRHLFEINHKFGSGEVSFNQFTREYEHLGDAGPLKPRVCLMFTWYSVVFNRNIGKTRAELALTPLKESARFKPLSGASYWVPHRRDVDILLDSMIARIVPQPMAIRRRPIYVPPNNDATIEADMLAALLDTSLADSTTLLEVAPIAAPPDSCSPDVVPTCWKQVGAAILDLVKNATPVGFFNILNGIRALNDECTIAHLEKLFRLIILSEQALRGLLALNANHGPGTITMDEFNAFFGQIHDPLRVEKCALHQWYASVINPYLGQPISSAGIVAFRDDSLLSAQTVYMPSPSGVREILRRETLKLIKAVELSQADVASNLSGNKRDHTSLETDLPSPEREMRKTNAEGSTQTDASGYNP